MQGWYYVCVWGGNLFWVRRNSALVVQRGGNRHNRYLQTQQVMHTGYFYNIFDFLNSKHHVLSCDLKNDLRHR